MSRREPSSKKNLEDKVEQGQTIVYQDEVHFQITTTVTCKWVVKGSRPTVKSAPRRTSVRYSGFVTPCDGRLFACSPDWFTWESTIESFRRFLAFRNNKKRFCIVVDNASWHKKAVKMILENKDGVYTDIKNRMDFLFLPPRSPDLNPIEMVWKMTRREITHNTYFKDEKELSKAIGKYFRKFEHHNEKLHSLCSFKHK